MEEKKSKLGFYFAAIGTVVGLLSLGLAVRQYYESKELREIQKELTRLQLEKIKKETKA